MGLREKYNAAMEAAKGRLDGTFEEREGKLYITGTTKTQADANRIWDMIKTVPDWKTEIIANVKSTGIEPEPTFDTYTVKPGDTLSKIAKAMLGDANAYMKIFEANKDVLADPDKIKPDQVLKIPKALVHK